MKAHEGLAKCPETLTPLGAFIYHLTALDFLLVSPFLTLCGSGGLASHHLLPSIGVSMRPRSGQSQYPTLVAAVIGAAVVKGLKPG